MTKYS